MEQYKTPTDIEICAKVYIEEPRQGRFQVYESSYKIATVTRLTNTSIFVKADSTSLELRFDRTTGKEIAAGSRYYRKELRWDLEFVRAWIANRKATRIAIAALAEAGIKSTSEYDVSTMHTRIEQLRTLLDKAHIAVGAIPEMPKRE